MQTTIQKIFILAAFIAAGTAQSEAEIFINSMTNSSSLVIASNEAIIISVARGSFDGPAGYCFDARLSLIGSSTQAVTFEFNPGNPPQQYSIAGPATLSSFTPSGSTNMVPVVMSFNRIQASLTHSFFVATNGSVLTVPAGKTCRLFQPIIGCPCGTYLQVDVQVATDVVTNIYVTGNEEFSGPVTLSFHAICSDVSRTWPLVSYYFTEDFVTLPESGLLRGPTGAFEMSVEKSVDLTNWVPVIAQNFVAQQKAFYRIKLAR